MPLASRATESGQGQLILWIGSRHLSVEAHTWQSWSQAC